MPADPNEFRTAQRALEQRQEEEAASKGDKPPPEYSERHKRRKAAMQKVADMRKVTRVRVKPRDDTVRKNIKHPLGTQFGSAGTAEWPLDVFTRRRIQEGDITVEDAAETQQRQEDRQRTSGRSRAHQPAERSTAS